MNSFFLSVILVPIIEIYLLIKIGSKIGALSTILLIFTTAVVGIYYAKYEGLNTLKSGFAQLSKNETPAYEVLSGAAIAFAALLLIIPGFATDVIGFLLIFPFSRKIIFEKVGQKLYKLSPVHCHLKVSKFHKKTPFRTIVWGQIFLKYLFLEFIKIQKVTPCEITPMHDTNKPLQLQGVLGPSSKTSLKPRFLLIKNVILGS